MSEQLRGYIRSSGFLQGMMIVIVLAGGIAGWQWLMRVTVEKIDIRGLRVASEHEIRALAGVDTGMVLFRLEPGDIEGRVEEHAWVERSEISRLPTGTLVITVTERTPIVRTLDHRGRPSFYLDRYGYPLVASDSIVFDVAVLSGYPEGFHPGEPTRNPMVSSLLKSLDSTSETSDAILSEVLIQDGEVWIRMEPAGGHTATRVRLGRGHFQEKLAELVSFQRQEMLQSPDKIFDLIDLRFNSQIVSRERQQPIQESEREETEVERYER